MPGLYAGELVRVVLGEAATLHGRVSSARDGEPIAGVEIRLSLEILSHRGALRPRTTSDEQGRYRFEHLPPGFLHATVEPPGHVGTSERLTLKEGEGRRLDLVLERGATIRGTVTNGETNLPLAGATVRNGWTQTPQRTTTDADGTYALSGIEVGSTAELYVTAPGCGEWHSRIFGVPAQGWEQDFFLLPGRRASGRIVDPEGNTVAGAYVGVIANDTRDNPQQMDGRFTRTTDDGRFEVEELRVDLRHSLLVRAEGFATGFHDLPDSEWQSMDIELGDVALARPALLAGRLVDPRGDPLPDHYVSVRVETDRRDILGPALDERRGYPTDGGYGGGAFGSRTDAHDLGEGEVRDDVELVLETGLSIAGVVVDPDGRPLPGADIKATPDRSALSATGAPARAVAGTFTEVDGTFHLRGLEPGKYTLLCPGSDGFLGAAELLSFTWWHGIEAGTTDLRLALERGAHISGQVVDPAGTPVAGCLVESLVFGEEVCGSTMTDMEGRFVLLTARDRPVDVFVMPPTDAALGIVRMPTSEWMQEHCTTQKNVAAGTTGLVLRLPRLR